MAANYGEYDPQVLRRLQMVELEMLKDVDEFCQRNSIEYFVGYGSAIGAVRHNGFIPWDDDIDLCMLRVDSERFVELARKDLEFSSKYDLIAPPNNRCPHMFIKLSKKGTKFITNEMQQAGLEYGISIDIFPLDEVPSDNKKFRRKSFWAGVFSKLLYIYYIKHLYIPVSGLTGKCASAACYVMHCVLKFLPFITPAHLQKWYLRSCYSEEKTGVYVDYAGAAKPTEETMRVEEMFPAIPFKFEHTTICLPKEYDRILRKCFGDYMQIPPIERRKNHAPEVLDFGDE